MLHVQDANDGARNDEATYEVGGTAHRGREEGSSAGFAEAAWNKEGKLKGGNPQTQTQDHGDSR